MLDYIIALMDDANDFSWGAAKASHAVPLCRMGQGEIKGHSLTEKIDRVGRANAQRHMPARSGKHPNSDKKNGQKQKSMVCTYFSQTLGTSIKHMKPKVSSTDSAGKSYPHSDVDCR